MLILLSPITIQSSGQAESLYLNLELQEDGIKFAIIVPRKIRYTWIKGKVIEGACIISCCAPPEGLSAVTQRREHRFGHWYSCLVMATSAQG